MKSQHFLINLVPHGNDREELRLNFGLYTVSHFKYYLLICSSITQTFAAMIEHSWKFLL